MYLDELLRHQHEELTRATANRQVIVYIRDWSPVLGAQ